MGKPEIVTGPNSEKGVVANPDSKGVKLEESSRRRQMATIDDDDERLLARIGYRQVRVAIALGGNACPDIRTGAEARVYKVVNSLVCYLNSWCPRLCSSNIWNSYRYWRSCDCSMGVVRRLGNGNVYSQFRSVMRLSLVNSQH